mmetsp:Transcript_34184/g.89156  ORF Transcript_34184/g.89156 Transcript_34184/m.89156 type:complete len:314 (-) Transcript_34184:112-1053(-)
MCMCCRNKLSCGWHMHGTRKAPLSLWCCVENPSARPRARPAASRRLDAEEAVELALVVQVDERAGLPLGAVGGLEPLLRRLDPREAGHAALDELGHRRRHEAVGVLELGAHVGRERVRPVEGEPAALGGLAGDRVDADGHKRIVSVDKASVRNKREARVGREVRRRLEQRGRREAVGLGEQRRGREAPRAAAAAAALAVLDHLRHAGEREGPREELRLRRDARLDARLALEGDRVPRRDGARAAEVRERVQLLERRRVEGHRVARQRILLDEANREQVDRDHLERAELLQLARRALDELLGARPQALARQLAA